MTTFDLWQSCRLEDLDRRLRNAVEERDRRSAGTADPIARPGEPAVTTP